MIALMQCPYFILFTSSRGTHRPPGRSRVLRFDLSRHWDYFKRASGSFLQHEVDSSSVLLFLFFFCMFLFFHLAHSRTSNLLEDLLRHGSVTNVSSFLRHFSTAKRAAQGSGRIAYKI